MDLDNDPLTFSVEGSVLTAASIEGSTLRIESLSSTEIGEDTLVVEARDALGNAVTDTMRVIIDDRPVSIPATELEIRARDRVERNYDAAGKRVPQGFWRRLLKW